MLAPHHRTFSKAALELVAQRFAALAEPIRLELLHALFAGEKSVTELVAAVGGSQANVSRHLQMLAKSQILCRRKAGLKVLYSIADPSLYQLCDIVCGSLERQLQRQAGVFNR